MENGVLKKKDLLLFSYVLMQALLLDIYCEFANLKKKFLCVIRLTFTIRSAWNLIYIKEKDFSLCTINWNRHTMCFPASRKRKIKLLYIEF